MRCFLRGSKRRVRPARDHCRGPREVRGDPAQRSGEACEVRGIPTDCSSEGCWTPMERPAGVWWTPTDRTTQSPTDSGPATLVL